MADLSKAAKHSWQPAIKSWQLVGRLPRISGSLSEPSWFRLGSDECANTHNVFAQSSEPTWLRQAAKNLLQACCQGKLVQLPRFNSRKGLVWADTTKAAELMAKDRIHELLLTKPKVSRSRVVGVTPAGLRIIVIMSTWIP